MEKSFILALDLAEILVQEYNIPFRQSHEIVALLVKNSEKHMVFERFWTIVILGPKRKANKFSFFETVAAIQSIFDVSCAQVPIFQHRNLNLCWRLSRCLDQANM